MRQLDNISKVFDVVGRFSGGDGGEFNAQAKKGMDFAFGVVKNLASGAGLADRKGGWQYSGPFLS